MAKSRTVTLPTRAHRSVINRRKDPVSKKTKARIWAAMQKSLRSMIEDTRGRLDDRPPEEEAAFADAQSRADGIYMALGEIGATRPMAGDTDTPPYRTGVDALKDGWRLFQASQILPHQRGAEFDVSYLKYEFFFERLVEVAA
mgnify:CR=1 FL=1